MDEECSEQKQQSSLSVPALKASEENNTQEENPAPGRSCQGWSTVKQSSAQHHSPSSHSTHQQTPQEIHHLPASASQPQLLPRPDLLMSAQ